MKAVFSTSSGCIATCQYPLAKSKVVNHLALRKEFSISSILGSGYASGLVTALSFLYTSRNNPIRPIFKLPKGGRKLVECLPIIIKKIGKIGIAEFYISPATCQKF